MCWRLRFSNYWLENNILIQAVTRQVGGVGGTRDRVVAIPAASFAWKAAACLSWAVGGEAGTGGRGAGGTLNFIIIILRHMIHWRK